MNLKKNVSFDELVQIADRLLGENGCPWDRKQTLLTLRPFILEETYELLEALDQNDTKGIIEEAGDVLFQVVFIAKLLEKDQKGSLEAIIQGLNDKLIRRHPHIFASEIAHTPEQVLKRWEEIKKEEKKRTGELEGIPKELPGIAKMQKVLKKLKKKEYFKEENIEKTTPDKLSTELRTLVLQAIEADIDLESLIRKNLKELEKLF
jgi:MazG family protein